MKYGTLSLRVSRPIWDTPERLQELIGMLGRHPQTFDEIALFTCFTHAPLPLGDVMRVAERTSEVIAVFKGMGYRCGINMLCTFGHLEENLEYSLNEPWQRMMDIDGNICRGVFCPEDPGMRGYIAECYRALAEAKPDFIWIDDDVRFEGHTPIAYACFCGRCLEEFSGLTGRQWTRQTLKAAFNSSDTQYALQIRKAWLHSNRSKLLDIMGLIRSAVDSVQSGLPVGLMCGESFYNGYGYGEWLEQLSRNADLPAMLRPGGGFYVDLTPTQILQKSQSLGRQAAEAGGTITDIQSEIECFPYARLGKSLKMTCTEAAVYIANGCTGTAFNIMGSLGAPIGEYEAFLGEIERYRDFYELISDTFKRSACEGIWQLSGRDMLAGENLGGEWLAGSRYLPVNGQTVELSTTGLPIADRQSAGGVTLITGTGPMGFSNEQIEKLLSGGVMLDGAGLECLIGMGFGDLLGFRIAGKREDDTVEELTDDAINVGFTGWHRDCRQSFKWWSETAYLLEPTDSSARITSKAVDFELKEIAPVSGIYENRLGGRIAVFGYFPWSFTGSLVRASQLKRIAVWLSCGTLPGYVESFERVAIWCRRDSENKPAVFVLNVSLDCAEDLKVNIADAPEHLMLHTPFSAPIDLAGSNAGNGYTTFTIPKLQSWQIAMLKK